MGMVQEYNIDILAIQEIIWMGQSILEKRKVISIIAAIVMDPVHPPPPSYIHIYTGIHAVHTHIYIYIYIYIYITSICTYIVLINGIMYHWNYVSYCIILSVKVSLVIIILRM
jgi:hypothetical protein